MANSLDELFLKTFLIQALDKSTGKSKELGVVEGVVIVGSKPFQNLGSGYFLYGPHVYYISDVPTLARANMDTEEVVPFCSAVEWHITNAADLVADNKVSKRRLPVIRTTAKETKPSNVCAVLLTNSEECSDVDWFKA